VILGFKYTATSPPVAGAKKFTTITLAGPDILGVKRGELPPLKKSHEAHKNNAPYKTMPESCGLNSSV
jgi:hypothetical protein